MKPPPSDWQKLDELADGLDAGWDLLDDPDASSTPQPAPVPTTTLAELDGDGEAAAEGKPHAQTQARSAQMRPAGARPTQARQNPARSAAPPSSGPAPVRISKRDRRDTERKRRAHEAEQRSLSKKQRKVARREEALRASEQSRLAQERALADRRDRKHNAADKLPKVQTKKAADAARPSVAQRIPARARHEHARSARTSAPLAPEKIAVKATPLVERGAKKLIVPLLIAILVAVTLGFALSRAR